MDDIIPVALVGFKAFLHQEHAAGNEEGEERDDRIDGKIGTHHQIVQTGHDQNRQVLVKVLHRNRVAGAHQNMATVLQQGVHGDDKVTR